MSASPCTVIIWPKPFHRASKSLSARSINAVSFGPPARPRPVAPGRGDRAKLGVGHAGDLVFAVFGREVGIGLSGHDDRVGLDGAERGLEIPPVQIVVADVGTQPCRDLGQDVVGVERERPAFPIVDQERVERFMSERPVSLLAVESLGGRPWRPRTRHRAQAGGRRLFVFAAAPCRIGGQHARASPSGNRRCGPRSAPSRRSGRCVRPCRDRGAPQ